MKKLLLTFTLFLTALHFGLQEAHAAPRDNDIIVLYTNDVHCGVDDFIGYAGLAFYADQMRTLTPYVTLVDAGDSVQGATIGTISNGRYIIEIINAMSYDLAVPGNHDFDYGMEQFLNFAKNLTCGYISCNFRDAVTGQLVFEPYRIFSYGGTKVAFVGACTPSTISSKASSFMESDGNFIYDFDGDASGEKLCASIQSAVDSARDEGAEFVILVGHLGENNVSEAWSAPHVAANTRGIDAIIDGHSHEVTPCLAVKNLDGKEVPITQAGTKLKYIGRLTITPSGEITTELIDSVSGRDEKIASLIHDINARYEDTLKKKYGHVSFDLKAVDSDNQWLLRNAETNLCNFVTDALLAASEGSADIALVNAGGIRANINSGDIDYDDILRVSPFQDTVGIYEVPGRVILDALELGAKRMPVAYGGLLHTAGLTYAINTSVPSPVQVDDKNMFQNISGDRRVYNVMVNGRALDPDKMYSVVSISYIISEHGSGHDFTGYRIVKPDFITLSDAVAHYVKSFGDIPDTYRLPQGRMLIK